MIESSFKSHSSELPSSSKVPDNGPFSGIFLVLIHRVSCMRAEGALKISRNISKRLFEEVSNLRVASRVCLKKSKFKFIFPFAFRAILADIDRKAGNRLPRRNGKGKLRL